MRLVRRRGLDGRGYELTVIAGHGCLESPAFPERRLDVSARERAPKTWRNANGQLGSLVSCKRGLVHADPDVVRRVEVEFCVSVCSEDSEPVARDLHWLSATVTTRPVEEAGDFWRKSRVVDVVTHQDRVLSAPDHDRQLRRHSLDL